MGCTYPSLENLILLCRHHRAAHGNAHGNADSDSDGDSNADFDAIPHRYSRSDGDERHLRDEHAELHAVTAPDRHADTYCDTDAGASLVPPLARTPDRA